MTFDAQLSVNLERVKLQIANAAQRSGRTAADVKLIAVTKYASAEAIRTLIALGCCDLGESRPQTLWEKAAQLAGRSVCWHMIGHLQRNKVERTLPLVSLIHSGDSMRLLTAINEAAAKLKRRAAVLLEVNVSGDASKHGFAANDVEPHLAALAGLSHLEIRGLMCMASREGDLNQARHEFAALRELRDQLQSVAPPQIKLDELSMGMSGDFEVAIEDGATIVRVGSALFEGIAM